MLFAVEGVAMGSLLPFLVPVLADRGLGAAEIGLALGASGLASLAAYPIWGAIADGRLGRRRAIVLSSLTAALGGLAILVAGDELVALTLALCVISAGALPWGPLTDALALQELPDPSAGYGRVRAWASLGWAAAAIAAGAAWLLVGPGPLIVAFSVVALIVAALVMPGVAPSSRAAEPRSVGPSRWIPLVRNPVLLGFLLGLFVTALGEHAAGRFTSLRILDQGGTVLLVGVAAALPALIEIPVFGGSRRYLPRLGLRLVFVAGAMGAALLMALVSIAPEAWMVTALRTIEGVPYALRYVAMVIIIGVIVPPHLHAVGQALAWLGYAGVAPIVADAAGGLIYAELGAPALFVAAALALLTGGAIVWITLRGRRFRRLAATAEVVDVSAAAPAPPPPV
jgi:PPP family 3-phenylpropionic acid transporter